MIGMAASTKADSRRLVTTIIALAPTNSTRLRKATETERADRGLDLRRVGGQPRDHLAGLGLVEENGRQRCDMREHVAAQIGDDALAERGDEVVAERARQRQYRCDPDHDQEIAVDQRHAAGGEAEIDHAPHRDGTISVVNAARISAPSAAAARQR